MALVSPLPPEHDNDTKQLAEFFNETLGFCPNSVLTMQRRPDISKAFINLNKAVMANEGRVTSAKFQLYEKTYFNKHDENVKYFETT